MCVIKFCQTERIHCSIPFPKKESIKIFKNKLKIIFLIVDISSQETVLGFKGREEASVLSVPG